MGLFSKATSNSDASTLTEQDVLGAMRTVIDPDLHRDVVSLGMVKDIKISGSKASFTFELTTPSCPLKGQLEAEAKAAVEKVAGVGNVSINMTARVAAHVDNVKESALPGVKNTIAVASGKGGVGKSTVAANLAVALAQDGAKVGLLDADIYGPSIPLMFGLQGEKPGATQVNGKTKMIPLEAHGVKVMSIGFLVDPDTAVVWRGPMASGALKQFMSDVEWGDLDYLIFDMPPGTGDIQLTLVQTIPLTGAVIVTTPQDVALADARKGVRMFEKVHVPVLGVVENMSYFICSTCGTREEIFAHGGGKTAAAQFGVPFLGELPIQTSLRIGGDKGTPIVSSEPKSPAALAFHQIASALAQQVSIRNLSPQTQPVEITL
ncbi:MAG: iron-sulfur cluster carrier protein ApbC [Candidatus Kapaibacterium sp.]|jgi:ATP-binding protein involved in chromosome partitioning